MTATLIRPAAGLSDLVAGIHTALDHHAGWAETAQLVADQLRLHLPGPEILTAEQRLGSPHEYTGHTLHVEPDGSFSIVGLVWRPGQYTRIHDHVTWCVLGVIQGVEHEELFDADLNLIGESDNHVGDVGGFAPPGDIHRVRNTGEWNTGSGPHQPFQSGSSCQPAGPNLFAPMISAPIPSAYRLTKASSTPPLPPERPSISHPDRVANIHSCSRSPAWPKWASRL